jgi:hypothetical protein
MSGDPNYLKTLKDDEKNRFINNVTCLFSKNMAKPLSFNGSCDEQIKQIIGWISEEENRTQYEDSIKLFFINFANNPVPKEDFFN